MSIRPYLLPLVLPAGLLLATACSDSELLALDGLPDPDSEHALEDGDGPPEIEIIEPVVQAVYSTDFPLSLLARVGDSEDRAEDLRIDWESLDSGELVAAGLVPASTGEVLAIAWLDPGVHTLLATVTDSIGQTAFDSVSFAVEQAEDPPDEPGEQPGDDPGDEPGEDPPPATEEDDCVVTVSIFLDEELLFSSDFLNPVLPEAVAPSIYINATSWWGQAGAEVDDLAILGLSSEEDLLSDDFSDPSSWNWFSGGSGNCGVAGGLGYATADWNALTHLDSIPLDRDLRYQVATRSSYSTGRYLLDLLNAPASAIGIRVAFCAEPDSMTCDPTTAGNLGVPPSGGWVTVELGGPSQVGALPVSPVVRNSWQILAMELEFGEACELPGQAADPGD